MPYPIRHITQKDIISDPVGSYREFRNRILFDGQLAPFPEFAPVIDFLIKELSDSFIQSMILEHPALRLEYTEVRTLLFHVNLTFSLDDKETYPYGAPFSAPYPYRPTIDAIEAAIRFFDKVNRLDPENRAVKLYHFDRYCYHRHALVTSEEVIILPTLEDLSIVDFIRTRSVPIEFVGVISKTMRVDGHAQSPLDFWYHDLNHARRLFAYIKNRLKEKGITSHEAALRYYSEVNEFMESVIVPKFISLTGFSDEEIGLRKLCTLIIFEIVHETALTLERDALIVDVLRGNGPQPFEYHVHDESLAEDNLRTPTGNIQSGAQHGHLDAQNATKVRYFLDAASIGLLANVYSKLNHYYYDNATSVNEDIVPTSWRTPEKIVEAAKYILTVLNYDAIPSDEELYKLVTDREGTKERILKPAITENESTQKVQDATDPLTSEEIITLIRSKGKKIYTIFGYSALGYESLDDMLAIVKEKLLALPQDEWIVAIGATEEGVGACYKVAKELGFETIGIVSTQALSYSGKFSDFVDMIYIVNDELWGGYIPGTSKLAETTKTFLSCSDFILALGGGDNTKVTLTAAKSIQLPFTYIPCDMNHESAKKKQIDDVRGSAFIFA
jgi:hypothetical protein